MVAVLGYSDEWDRLDTLHAWRVAAERAVEGPRSEAVAVALTDWAEVRQRRGDLLAADTLLVATLGIHRELGLQSMPAGRTLTILARLSVERGLLPRADSLFRSAGGRMGEADAAFARALRGHEERFPPDFLFTAQVRLDYGRLLVGLKRGREARSMLQEAVPVLVRRWGEQDSRVREARDSPPRTEGPARAPRSRCRSGTAPGPGRVRPRPASGCRRPPWC